MNKITEDAETYEFMWRRERDARMTLEMKVERLPIEINDLQWKLETEATQARGKIESLTKKLQRIKSQAEIEMIGSQNSAWSYIRELADLTKGKAND